MKVAFAWQDKRALRVIREQVQDFHSAIAVYVALTVIASDTESEHFQTTHQWVAGLTGLSQRTVGARLKDLERIGAVRISSPSSLRQPNFYTLPPISSDCRTFGNGCRTFGSGGGTSVADIRRKEEEGNQGNGSPTPTPQQPSIPKPRGVGERMGLENQKKILEAKAKILKEETTDEWAKREYPEKLAELREAKRKIAAIEEALLA